MAYLAVQPRHRHAEDRGARRGAMNRLPLHCSDTAVVVDERLGDRLGEATHDRSLRPGQQAESEHPPSDEQRVGDRTRFDAYAHELRVQGDLCGPADRHEVAAAGVERAHDVEPTRHGPQHAATQSVIVVGVPPHRYGPDHAMLRSHDDKAGPVAPRASRRAWAFTYPDDAVASSAAERASSPWSPPAPVRQFRPAADAAA